ncbi:hypothetical protein PVAR5_8384 [Paecilomyces variotii No. 5]|uniref:2-dehydropantoate 2-reductase n=1 Tax=Byssochlamys spectabilis (strain No. 5 / NBRC 109023) TaxID=1356009 RepID=V5GC76_BYSSN|nr:hypothetical protein PVAR5_8384 [Paecilomyces variotii No. 5]
MSDDDSTINVLVHGLGAIGSFYAFILDRAPNVHLSVIARSNYDVVNQKGLTIKSQNHGEHVLRPAGVFRTPAEAGGPRYDYVVCAHKAVDQEKALVALKPVIDENTTVVIIQNGVGNEEPFREAFPNSSIITCVTWTGATQTALGLVEHRSSENLLFNLYPHPSIPPDVEEKRLSKFASLLKEGKTVFTVPPDIQLERWEKVVWNSAWNAVTALTLTDTQTWLHSSPSAMAMTRRLMTDVLSVGKAIGVPLDEGLVDRLIEKALSLPGLGSSMQVDRKMGRTMEVEVILGVPVKKARELGLDVPALEMVYALVKAVDVSTRKQLGMETLARLLPSQFSRGRDITFEERKDAYMIRMMLEYIYTGNCSMGSYLFNTTWGNIDRPILAHTKLFLLAHQYELAGLKDISYQKCEQFCKHDWNSAAFCESVRELFAIDQVAPNMLKLMAGTAADHAEELLQDEGFLDMCIREFGLSPVTEYYEIREETWLSLNGSI